MGESDKEADSTASDIQEPARLMVTFNVREIMSRIQARCNSSSEAEQPPQIFERESEIEVRLRFILGATKLTQAVPSGNNPRSSR